MSTGPNRADSSQVWGRLARCSAAYGEADSDRLDLYYGDEQLRRSGRGRAHGELGRAIRAALAEGVSEHWIIDALCAGAPTLDLVDAWSELTEARDAPERQRELMRKLTRGLLGEPDDDYDE